MSALAPAAPKVIQRATPEIPQEHIMDMPEEVRDIPDSQQIHVRRVMLEVNPTAAELAQGYLTHIEHAHSVFSAGNSTEEELQNVIITGMESRMTYSDCPESVTLGMRMFENDVQNAQNSGLGVSNEEGWLYKGSSSEWGPGSTSTHNGFTNLHAIMPYERSRDTVKLYDPQNVQNNRFIQTYGGYHGKNLWNNIIPFPKQNYYYVDKDHVVMQVVAQNWDTLGINPGEELLHENRYVKVAGPVVDSVIKQLETTILTQMPFTNLSAASFKFSTKPLREWKNASADKTYKVMCELKVSYMFPKVDAVQE